MVISSSLCHIVSSVWLNAIFLFVFLHVLQPHIEMEHLLLPYLGLDRLLPPGAANQLTDPNWLDLQRRMVFPPGTAGHLIPHAGPSGAGSHLPGVYPPVSLASDLLAREREKLDRLGGLNLFYVSYFFLTIQLCCII